MKKIFIFSLLISILLFTNSCKKQSASPTPIKTKTELLTAHTWVYYELYYNYNQTNTSLVYKAGKPNNLVNLSGYTLTFRADGTYSINDPNATNYNGTWKFLNNETEIQTIDSGGTNSSTVIELTDSAYTYYAMNKGVYGKLVPQ